MQSLESTNMELKFIMPVREAVDVLEQKVAWNKGKRDRSALRGIAEETCEPTSSMIGSEIRPQPEPRCHVRPEKTRLLNPAPENRDGAKRKVDRGHKKQKLPARVNTATSKTTN